MTHRPTQMCQSPVVAGDEKWLFQLHSNPGDDDGEDRRMTQMLIAVQNMTHPGSPSLKPPIVNSHRNKDIGEGFCLLDSLLVH